MTSIFLSPHNDDEALWGTFTLLRHKPFVIVCLRSVEQLANGITAEERERETDGAMEILGCGWEQWWSFPDVDTEWDGVREALLEGYPDPERIWAPAPAKHGHPAHNVLGALALELYGPERVTSYMTYDFGRPKHRNGVEVPYENDWLRLKHLALACYESQYRAGPARFFAEDLREYVAA